MITDKGLEKLWLELRDIPTTEDGIEIDQSFHIWPKGTDVNVVWHWFDDRHSKGMVKGLMYGDK